MLRIKARAYFLIYWGILLISFPFRLIKGDTEKEKYYKSCIEIFRDEEKCRKMLGENKPQPNLNSQEDNANLKQEKFYLRDELKQTLYSKNKIFVKNLLGEPNQILEASGKEILIYLKPISKKEESAEFDKEIRVIFQKGLVNRVLFPVHKKQD